MKLQAKTLVCFLIYLILSNVAAAKLATNVLIAKHQPPIIFLIKKCYINRISESNNKLNIKELTVDVSQINVKYNLPSSRQHQYKCLF